MHSFDLLVSWSSRMSTTWCLLLCGGFLRTGPAWRTTLWSLEVRTEPGLSPGVSSVPLTILSWSPRGQRPQHSLLRNIRDQGCPAESVWSPPLVLLPVPQSRHPGETPAWSMADLDLSSSPSILHLVSFVLHLFSPVLHLFSSRTSIQVTAGPSEGPGGSW